MDAGQYLGFVRSVVAGDIFVRVPQICELAKGSGTVGVDCGSGFDDFLGELDERHGSWTCGHLKPDTAQFATLTCLLHGDHHGDFVAAGARFSGAYASHEGFIEFHGPRQQVSFGTHHRPSQFVHPCPGSFVGSEAENTLQTLRRNAVLLRRDEPDRCEPCRQRRAGAVKDRAGRHRRFTAALLAHPQAPTGAPKIGRFTGWTNKPVGPSQPHQIVQTGFIIGEPRQHVLVGHRIIDARFGMATFDHKNSLLHLSRYPEQVFDSV